MGMSLRRGKPNKQALLKKKHQDSRLLRPITGRQRALRILAIFFIAVISVNLVSFQDMEGTARSMRLSVLVKAEGVNTLSEWARNQVVIVRLSDDTFASLNLPPPAIPRNYHAKLIRELAAAGAKVIAFDLLFHIEKPEDTQFAAAITAKPKIVWACLFENYNTPDHTLVRPAPRLLRASPYMGYIQMPFNPNDSKISSLEPVVIQKDDKGVPEPIPAISVEAVRLALGVRDQPWKRAGDRWICGNMVIPVEGGERGKMKIKFTKEVEESEIAKGAELTKPPFFEVNYEDVITDALRGEFYSGKFKDKIVLVGNVTATGSDVAETPIGNMSGVEVHAHAIATLLEGSFLHDAQPWQNYVAVSIPVALVCLLGIYLPWYWLGPAALGIFAGNFTTNMYLFVDHALVVHLAAPSIGILLATSAILVERGLIEERDKNRSLALLQRSMSEKIANYVLANPDLLNISRTTATVLFSDIRNFTAMSEQLPPEQVVARLNEYLQAMTDTVFRHDGVVDKFIGDAIMALYNTPFPQPDHAHRAVATAIDMQSALLELQERWRAAGLPLIDIGIGINTGEMVVGNMGSRERVDFTVIGDAVNLASRVEGLNKELKSRILVTASTYEFVKDQVRVRGPMTVQVKGKQEEVVVYEVFGWRQDA